MSGPIVRCAAEAPGVQPSILLSFQLDPRIIQPFLVDCRDTIGKLDNQNMKSIKGLEDRLYALDQMIASCKKLVNEQKELAQVAGGAPAPAPTPAQSLS